MSQGVMHTNKTKFFFVFVASLFFALVLFAFQFFFGVFTTIFGNTVQPTVQASVVRIDTVSTHRNVVGTEVRV